MEALSEDERRTWRRFGVPVAGKLFAPEGGVWTCEVLDLSPGGAKLQAADFPPLGPLVLYLDRIGRVDAQALDMVNGMMRLCFVCGEQQRHHISQVLGQMIQGGVAHLTRLRRQNRIPLSDLYFVRACGTVVSCDALDISLRGLSLRTKVLPPVGEFVTVGQARGRVVRHHGQGIAVEFVGAASGAVVRFPGGYGGNGRGDTPKPG